MLGTAARRALAISLPLILTGAGFSSDFVSGEPRDLADGTSFGSSGGRMPVSVSKMETDMRDAADVTNQWWADHFNEYFGVTYSPPSNRGLYDESNAPSCPLDGGQPAQPDNAFYCPNDDYLAFGKTLLEHGYQVAGTAGAAEAYNNGYTYVVVAHEWGHAIQERLPEKLKEQYPKQYPSGQGMELQADCLAGAMLYGAKRDGTLEFDEYDENAVAMALAQTGTPWTDRDTHGDAFQRVEAFNDGRNAGINACFPGS